MCLLKRGNLKFKKKSHGKESKYSGSTKLTVNISSSYQRFLNVFCVSSALSLYLLDFYPAGHYTSILSVILPSAAAAVG